MSPRLLAASLGAVAGVLLVVAGGLPFLAGGSRDWHGVLAVVGYAVALATLCVIGYAIVAHAPLWLRFIVSVAFPLLAASVWQVVDQAIDDGTAGWRGPASTHLLGGVIALLAALAAFARRTRRGDDDYAPTHHR
jgi:hypothetical protein